MALGQADEQANDSTAGVANYRRAADAATGPTDSAEALFYLADAATTGNDPKTASDALTELIVQDPTTQRAADALTDQRLLPNAAVSPLDRALVAFHHQQNDAATAALQPIADAGGLDSAQAQYYLGLLSERAEDWQGAIDHYTAAINSPVADPVLRAQAYWDRGTVQERIGLTSDAIDSYAAVYDRQPLERKRGGRALPGRLPGVQPRPDRRRSRLLAAAGDERAGHAKTAHGVTSGWPGPRTRWVTRQARRRTSRPPSRTGRWTTTACARRLASRAKRRCPTLRRWRSRRRTGLVSSHG